MSDGARAAAIERLRHMSEAADAIASYVGRGRAMFDSDPAIRDAILYQIIVLGEAAKAALGADPRLEAAYPAVDWSPVARMRDRVTHRYWRPTEKSSGQRRATLCQHSDARLERLSPRWVEAARRELCRGLTHQVQPQSIQYVARTYGTFSFAVGNGDAGYGPILSTVNPLTQKSGGLSLSGTLFFTGLRPRLRYAAMSRNC